LGEGIRPEHLNDDRLGRILDKLYAFGLTELFVTVALDAALYTANNLQQLGQLRWIFQCFMSIHWLTFDGLQHLTNLTAERLWILQFRSAPCRKYYLLS
jgi:Domain of unknown function (DUF4277)